LAISTLGTVYDFAREREREGQRGRWRERWRERDHVCVLVGDLLVREGWGGLGGDGERGGERERPRLRPRLRGGGSPLQRPHRRDAAARTRRNGPTSESVQGCSPILSESLIRVCTDGPTSESVQGCFHRTLFTQLPHEGQPSHLVRVSHPSLYRWTHIRVCTSCFHLHFRNLLHPLSATLRHGLTGRTSPPL
jgi:hypothetical protein